MVEKDHHPGVANLQLTNIHTCKHNVLRQELRKIMVSQQLYLRNLIA